MAKKLSDVSSVMKNIYGPQIMAQLRALPALPALSPSYTPDPSKRSATFSGDTVGEFLKFIKDNNIPDSAEFYDTGYECDGVYDFTWNESIPNTKEQNIAFRKEWDKRVDDATETP